MAHRPVTVPLLAVIACSPLALAAQEKSMPQQIADVMVQLNGGIHKGFRFTHAKGLILTRTFTPAKDAASVSRAADSAETKRAGRYQIIPVGGVAHLDSTAATKVSPKYLFEDLRRRIARGPIKYRLLVQLANPGDPTNDGSIVWPSDRKRVELGTISLTTVAPNNEELQRSLAFNPIFLTDGIQLSDDPFVPLRSAVYALSVQHRH